MKIEGLKTATEDSQISDFKHEDKSPEILAALDLENIESDGKVVSGVGARRKNQPKSDKTIAVTVEDHSAVDDAIQEHLGKEDGVYFCRVCDYSRKERKDVKKHIETHIEGLSYSCSLCEKTFRSRSSLNRHNSKDHKN